MKSNETADRAALMHLNDMYREGLRQSVPDLDVIATPIRLSNVDD